jgi:hypothetical protein
MSWKQTFITGLADQSTSDLEGVGTIRREGPNKIYKWVKYNNGAGDVAAIVGDVAYYYGVSADAVTGGYENSVVTMDRTDAYMGAGVFQSIIADASYGWIQIRGPATLTQALTAGADGNALTHTGAGADGALDVSAAVTDTVVAFATDVSAKKIVCNFPF